MNDIKVTLIHKEHGQHIIYIGLYTEFFSRKVMEHPAYKEAILSGDASLNIEAITEEEKFEIVEQMRFEASLKQDVSIIYWKGEV